MGLDEQGWTADNPRISGAMHTGNVGQLWYIGRDESWYIVDAKSHQRLLHAAKLFVASDEGSNTAVGTAASSAFWRVAPSASFVALCLLCFDKPLPVFWQGQAWPRKPLRMPSTR